MTWLSGDMFEGVNTETLGRDRDEERLLAQRAERKIVPLCYFERALHEWINFGTDDAPRLECGPCGISQERWMREIAK